MPIAWEGVLACEELALKGPWACRPSAKNCPRQTDRRAEAKGKKGNQGKKGKQGTRAISVLKLQQTRQKGTKVQNGQRGQKGQEGTKSTRGQKGQQGQKEQKKCKTGKTVCRPCHSQEVPLQGFQPKSIISQILRACDEPYTQTHPPCFLLQKGGATCVNSRAFLLSLKK